MTGGGKPPAMPTQEMEKIEAIYGSNNPILSGMVTGVDSLETTTIEHDDLSDTGAYKKIKGFEHKA